ncbi:hypothetical protein BIY24_08620 [Halobacteriovorax marinus]|uniref:PilZ domain-containing protein n=1 Tax=Halobacteriovorax marinus TaxID=97084 RepID=UPI000BC34BE0|nr:PilZ domain-containing protein [Halobacteriovorax marinus]ATH08012.1 hypothetical protein BIY24_08620 [Halobacteriovorax marinus]
MKYRPLPFVILGILHLVEPLLKLAYFKATTHFPIMSIIENITHLNAPRAVFEFWFLFPIGGLALLGVKKWSYPIFVSVQLYSIYRHLNYEPFTWPYATSTPQWPSLVLLACNIAIIIYFLLPEIRKPFFNKEDRWWEHRERYTIRIPCSYTLSSGNTLKDAEILNISHSGAFVTLPESENICQEKLIINITFLNDNICLGAKVISAHEFDSEKGFGIAFEYENIWEKLYMTKIMKMIARAAKKHHKQQLAA